nr:hypothetical protein MFLOJ_06650 [Mycobacterium florentinum]
MAVYAVEIQARPRDELPVRHCPGVVPKAPCAKRIARAGLGLGLRCGGVRADRHPEVVEGAEFIGNGHTELPYISPNVNM